MTCPCNKLYITEITLDSDTSRCILEFEDGTVRNFIEKKAVHETIGLIRKEIQNPDHLFRGKRVDNGEWVTGRSLFYHTKYKKAHLMIGEGVQNGSVNGYEVHINSLK